MAAKERVFAPDSMLFAAADESSISVSENMRFTNVPEGNTPSHVTTAPAAIFGVDVERVTNGEPAVTIHSSACASPFLGPYTFMPPLPLYTPSAVKSSLRTGLELVA